MRLLLGRGRLTASNVHVNHMNVSLTAARSRCFSSPSSERTSHIGVAAALRAVKSTNTSMVKPRIFEEFSLEGRVAVVSGGNRGLGLEMALALAEAGARVYALDLPSTPGDEFQAAANYVEKFGTGAKLEYVLGGVDVTVQKKTWQKVEEIGDREGRVDIGVAAAGILQGAPALEYKAEEFQKVVMDVNVNGVLYTAQAVGRQMERFKMPGSIIMIASMSGSITNLDQAWVAYNTSKSAVKQMARSMACELGPAAIRVNSLSPGYIYTSLTAAFLDKQPELFDKWSAQNPLGRLGRPDELRGVVTWLASDASTFCTGSDILVSGGHHAW
ncbi:sorbose reductase sou1 [Ramaria rubella]|nr:sorbose reductase sou1 [Ramaria rubella]